MICFSFKLSEKMHRLSKRGPVVLVLVLGAENLDRMKLADPLDIQPRLVMKGGLVNDRIWEMDIVVAYEDSLNQIIEFQKSNELMGLMRWLERGRIHQVGDAIPAVPLRQQ
jgi:hypothetical protein